MDKVIVYQKPTCTTSRKAVKKLEEMGIEFQKVNYYDVPFTKNKLKTLLKKADLKPEAILRKKAKEYKNFDFKNKNYTKDQLLDFFVKYPDLIERPIIEKGERAVLARPVEKIDELF
ncbi:MAG: arsenate reductase [Melioribacteraceae bacterium]|nr:arsenate reductase [Melioribacteraceae bacterium]MCF8354205.1 arsenate reductase [Melioribacteraceae bacterium]MCF8392851.1 arsenate reductase [Melioribacteraceae bacterium]MCF8418663.1 arsenate reductase [Melioribacteraceae bacterium]